MPRTPEFVVTGVHVPKVAFWARVLVSADRLQQVRDLILMMGVVYLQPGEVLEVDTRPGDDIERAMTVLHRDADVPRGTCLVAWNESAGDITVFAADADRVAAIAGPLAEALAEREPNELITKAVAFHCETIDSIRVGSVNVFFDHGAERKGGPDPEEDREDEPDEWLAAQRRITALKNEIIEEEVRISRLDLSSRRAA